MSIPSTSSLLLPSLQIQRGGVILIPPAAERSEDASVRLSGSEGGCSTDAASYCRASGPMLAVVQPAAILSGISSPTCSSIVGLSMPTYLPTYLSTYLPTYLLIYLPTYPPNNLSTYSPAPVVSH